ncbi:MAG: E3 binding domain-containing protein, partial [Cohaesibacter sp.]|nr:E3 binding domain-containing protein [Cohaesibacter sp.]
VEAEIVEWEVKVGDFVKEDDVLAAVMTDKATVEIPSPVTGTIVALSGELGEMTAVGAEIIAIEVEGQSFSDIDEQDLPASPLADLSIDANQDSAEIVVETVKREEAEEVERVSAPAVQPALSVAPQSSNMKPNASASYGLPRAVGEKPLASPSVRRRAREAGIRLDYVRGSGPAGRILHDD